MILDCDVLQADGGTRTAAITGACVALAIALNRLVAAGTLKVSPLRQMVAATSVGIVDGHVLLDLAYEEDSRATVDMNVVMLADGGLVETQATAEKESYSRAQLNQMLDFAEKGIRELLAAQQAALERWSAGLGEILVGILATGRVASARRGPAVVRMAAKSDHLDGLSLPGM